MGSILCSGVSLGTDHYFKLIIHNVTWFFERITNKNCGSAPLFFSCHKKLALQQFCFISKIEHHDKFFCGLKNLLELFHFFLRPKECFKSSSWVETCAIQTKKIYALSSLTIMLTGKLVLLRFKFFTPPVKQQFFETFWPVFQKNTKV